MPNVKRHYTISTVMKKTIYYEYVNAINSYEKGSEAITFDESVLQENAVKTSEVIVTLKDYHKPKGFSHRISNF